MDLDDADLQVDERKRAREFIRRCSTAVDVSPPES
jgi:hypothetical protein